MTRIRDKNDVRSTSFPETKTKEPAYIVTESQLMIWRAGCIKAAVFNPDERCDGCEFAGKESAGRKNCCDFDDDAVEKMFRQHRVDDITVGMVYAYEAGLKDGKQWRKK